jgi:diguanylate cyclase (GGDEF)-like protein
MAIKKTKSRNLVDTIAFRQSMLHLLEAAPPGEGRLMSRIAHYEKQGHPVYSALLSILTHLNFTEREARRHWRHIREHRDILCATLGRDIGLRVALLDYFVNLSQALKNPKVIEISIYESTERSAVSDGLSGLYNHNYCLQAIKRELLRARRHSYQLSFVLLDLDDFKKVNDTYGHLEGDRLLMQTAAIIKSSLREIDIAARYGGEEFAILLPDTPHTGAFVVADRVRQRIETHFQRDKKIGRVTISGGIATCPDDGTTPEELIRKADECLYRAKAGGKNCVVLSSGERRQHPRTQSNQRLTLRMRNGRTLETNARNISAGGLLVRADQSLAIGTPLTLTLRPARGPRLLVPGRVVHAQKVGAGRAAWALGLRLLQPLAKRPSATGASA